ncbi:PID-CTERM protein-sorting domain-containing protein [Hymenobacter lucidus]|uniref:VPDSG-CTERM sorting domain-containing protein n=1 Tax=Hymenobacter lucidus TaxID=2880930 RepID=A0ABS8AS24_9BACT|nr:hypothetical protein [Hymenobacter lucidus]MCB2408793.1 hypothetical protein [Hymenobacter lucidus]
MKHIVTVLRLSGAVVFVSLLSSLEQPAYAQGPGNGGPRPADTVPIDGGVSLLLAAGAAYGLRRLRQSKSR